jgi:alkanesulfonate monooxygenase SsuD/methylene tetrahydromethanopterin reductase-like flavin-dependent oxidoreductase (luciferase family)
MKVGLHISDFTWDGGAEELRFRLADIAQRAELAGVDRISVMDHVWQIGHIGPPEHEMLEAYTALGWLAAKTERVKLLTMVTAVVYREPGLLAKAMTTLDVLSRPPPSVSSGSKRPSSSASRCGRAPTRRSRASTTTWPAR